MIKTKYLKVLTSVFIVLLFILIFSPSTYANDINVFTYPIVQASLDYFSNNSAYLFNQYSNYLVIEGYQSGSYPRFCIVGYNDDSIDIVPINSGGNLYFQVNNPNGSTFLFGSSLVFNNSQTNCYVRSFDGFTQTNASEFTLNPHLYWNGNYSTLESYFSSHQYGFIKGSSTIMSNGNVIYQESIPYDLSFVINDESTNTEHNFDFNFVEGEFADGRSFEADDLVLGHYVVSISSLVHNTYELLDSTENTWWVCGYIDYIDYDNTSDSKTQFYWSSGYETLKILNEKSNPLTCYRFSFKGYSSDSFNYENLVDSTNIINVSNSKSYYLSDKYSCPVGSTFAYSNRNIYYGVDTSLYGFNGLTDKLFFEEGNDIVTLGVPGVKVNEIMSDSSYIDSQVSSFGTNNDSSSYPSSSVVLSSDGLHTYSGTNIDEIQPYSSVINYSGNSNQQAVKDLTEDWTIKDYVAQLPKTISNVPTAITDNIKANLIPKESELVTNIEDFNNWADNHFGSFYKGISYVWDLIKTIDSKYTSTYSQYPFTIPGIRWFNPITGEKEILVDQQTIDLGAICMNDDDWLMFWSITRYLTSFLIYITLILMLYNKLRNLLGYDGIYFSGASSALGSINSMKDNINDSVSDLRYKSSPLKRLKDSRVDHTWIGPSM